MKKALLIFALSACAWGHDFWLKPTPNRVVLEYGHEGGDEKYSPGVLKKAAGLNAGGAPVNVTVTEERGRCVLQGGPETVQIGAEVDTGFWTKSVRGWSNKSKREVSSYLLSEWSVYYCKVVLQPSASVGQAFGHRLEFVPAAVEEKTVRVRLLLNGQPLPNKPVYSQHDKVGETDSQGELSVQRGAQTQTVLSASHKEPLLNHPDADRLQLHAVLTL